MKDSKIGIISGWFQLSEFDIWVIYIMSDRGNRDSEVRGIISGLPGAVILLSSDEFRVKYINDSFRHFLPKRLVGRDISGMKLSEVVDGDENSSILITLRKALSTNEKVEIKEFQIINEDGIEFLVDWSAQSIDNGTENKDILIAILDMTESKQSQHLSEALNQVNAYINSTLDYREIMERVLKEGAKALHAESSLINMREGDHWVARFEHNFSTNIVGQPKTDVESPTSMLVAQEKKVMAIDDAQGPKGRSASHETFQRTFTIGGSYRS